MIMSFSPTIKLAMIPLGSNQNIGNAISILGGVHTWFAGRKPGLDLINTTQIGSVEPGSLY